MRCNLFDPLYMQASRAGQTERICRTLIATPPRTLGNRKSLTSHTRRADGRGRLTGPLWQHSPSHGSPAKYRANTPAKFWIYTHRTDVPIFRRTPHRSTQNHSKTNTRQLNDSAHHPNSRPPTERAGTSCRFVKGQHIFRCYYKCPRLGDTFVDKKIGFLYHASHIS